MQYLLVGIILAVCAVFIVRYIRRLAKGETCDCGQCEGCPFKSSDTENCKKDCCQKKK